MSLIMSGSKSKMRKKSKNRNSLIVRKIKKTRINSRINPSSLL